MPLLIVRTHAPTTVYCFGKEMTYVTTYLVQLFIRVINILVEDFISETGNGYEIDNINVEVFLETFSEHIEAFTKDANILSTIELSVFVHVKVIIVDSCTDSINVLIELLILCFSPRLDFVFTCIFNYTERSINGFAIFSDGYFFFS